jgi:hypothetical protein
MQLSNFLRNVLKLDAASCLAMAALVLPGAGALGPLLGLDATELRLAAAPLIPIGLFIGWLGTRREASAALIGLVILGNLSWTAGSLGAAAAIPSLTALGQVAIAGQGLFVLAITAAEAIGLRSSVRNVVARA